MSDLKGAKVLIVDDHEANREILSRRLKRIGYAPLTAGGGRAAVDMIRSEPPDIVLLDMMMPGMDGLQVLEAVRADYSPTDLPILMVTAKDESDALIESFELGANDYITKPYEFAVVMARMRVHLERKAAAADLRTLNHRLEQIVVERTEELRRRNEALLAEISLRRETEAELVVQKNRAEKASSAKTLFLANMTHELKTPLHAIIGFADLLIKEVHFGNNLSADLISSYAGYIGESGRRLDSIINDILQVSRADFGDVVSDMQNVNLRVLLDDCLAKVAAAAQEKNVSFEMDVADDIDVFADPMMIKRAVSNLLSNAVKFSDPDQPVQIEAETGAGGDVTICIRDRGIGMSPSEIKQAMEPFFQVDLGISRKYEGTGLGLPIAQKLVELHNGKLELESEVGRGLTARITLAAAKTLAARGAAA